MLLGYSFGARPLGLCCFIASILRDDLLSIRDAMIKSGLAPNVLHAAAFWIAFMLVLEGFVAWATWAIFW